MNVCVPFPARALLMVIGAATAAYCAHATITPAAVQGEGALDQALSALVVVGAVVACAWRAVAVRAQRLPWSLLAVAMGLSAAGNAAFVLTLVDGEPAPSPSLADVFWLATYPPGYVAIVLLARARIRGIGLGLWLDGLIAAAAIAALSSAFVIAPLSRLGDGHAALVTHVALAIGDVVMLGIVLTMLSLSGWAMAGSWRVLASGLAVITVAHSVLVVATVSDSAWAMPVANSGLLVGTALIAVAAWTRATSSRREIEGAATLAVPLIAAMVVITLMVIDAWSGTAVPTIVLCAVGLVAVVARMALSTYANHRLLRISRGEATTDVLTGLSNRRHLIADLDDFAGDGQERALILYDLDGFKTYNDMFGHQAGDALLARIGGLLQGALPPNARAYRLGGDEFCVLAVMDDTAAADGLARDVARAIHQHGDGFEVGASFGIAFLPDGADGADALSIADGRMYSAKASGRRSAGRQTIEALAALISERSPELCRHAAFVAELADEVARVLGADVNPELLRGAARLHDLGKLAIPDAVLGKRGELDQAELAFVRRHSLIGERVLATAPALEPIARIVRATHERWDGGGYPDGLRREEIPPAARIIHACDAFGAMITERPHRRALRAETALDELHRCAGTQFDPAVVAAVDEAITRRAGVWETPDEPHRRAA